LGQTAWRLLTILCKNQYWAAMKIKYAIHQAGQRAQSAFSLVEVMVASALAGLMFMAGMTAFTSSFRIVGLDRENSRAMQILLEKTELVRLYNWDQITGNDTNTFIPATFTAPFSTATNNVGFNYWGTVLITNAPITETYSNDLREVIITLTWTSINSESMLHSRSMTTFVSQYGLQNYLY
jgi:prepilin-type N-terminal cleavage/methylation domain-containing protein